MTHESNRAPAAPDEPTDTGIPCLRWSKEAEMLESWAAPVPASTGRKPCPICTEGYLLQAHVCNKCETVIGTADDARVNVAARELDADAERRALSKRLREHNDPRLYREADVLMSEAADALDRATAESAPASAAPDWQIVPKEPTDEMRAACQVLAYSDDIDAEWGRMLAAAPSNSPVGAKEQDK